MPAGGVPVVNRLSSLSGKFFMVGQGPNFSDHDCRSGSLIEPNGYQILTSKLESESEVLSALAQAEAGLDSVVSGGDEDYLLREMNDAHDAVNRNEAAEDPGYPNQDHDMEQSHPGASSPLQITAGRSYSTNTSQFPSVTSAERFSPGQEAFSVNSNSSSRLGRFSPEHSRPFISVEIAAHESNNNNKQSVQEAGHISNDGLTEEDRRIDDRNRTLAEIGKRMEEKKKFIKLIAVDEDREIHFRVKRTTVMVKVKRSYSERVGVNITSVKFVYNGQIIHDDDTANALEMDDYAIIKVNKEQPTQIADLKKDWTSDEDAENEPSPIEMLQTDGTGDLSSDSSLSDDYEYEFSVAPKRRRIVAPDSSSSDKSISAPENSISTDGSRDDCLDSEEVQPDENSNEVSFEDYDVETGSLDEFLNNLPTAKVTEDELGRPHIKCPTSGPAFIFFKSCRTKGASISRHCNDLINIAEVSYTYVLVDFIIFNFCFHSGSWRRFPAETQPVVNSG